MLHMENMGQLNFSLQNLFKLCKTVVVSHTVLFILSLSDRSNSDIK